MKMPMPDSVEIDALLDACRTAASSDSQTLALTKLAAVIPKTEETRHDEIALFLIRQVVIIDNASPVTVSLDKCLNACGPRATLTACSQTFLDAASIKIESPCPLETSFRTVRRLILTIPESNSDESLWVQRINTPGTRNEIMIKAAIDNIVSMALLIPSQISNACHFQKLVLPAWCVRSRYVPRLVECALAMDQVSRTPTADLYLQNLVAKIVHNGGSDEVAIGLYQYYHKCSPDSDWFRATILGTMRGLTTARDVATLLRSILRHLLSKSQCPLNDTVNEYCREKLFPYLDLVCGPILEVSRDVREAFVQLSVLSSSSCSSRADTKSKRVFCHCIAMLLAECQTNDEDGDSSDEENDSFADHQQTSVLEHHLNEVASCWSETVFVKRTDAALQRHVTNFILSAISMLEKENYNPFSSLAGTLLNGVSARLSSSLYEIRRDGMLVGEALAACMGQELKFEEVDDEREEQNEEPTVEEEVTPMETPVAKNKSRKKKSRRRRRKPRQVDPDAEYVSDQDSSDSSESFEDTDDENSDDDDDSVWDDTDELIPYNLDDDEQDLRETATPLYLRECLEMLRTVDTAESASSRHETGLDTISSLVRSNPVDLPDLVVSLCKALVTMENKFDLPEFNTKLAAGLLSLTVMQPLSAGECLINEFFGGLHGLDIRFLILRTIEDAAYELCGALALKEEREKRSSERTSPSQRVSGKRRLVPETSTSKEIEASADRAVASVESRTRRWGRGSRQTKPFTVVNKFAPIAPPWFYALVSGFMEHKDDTTLWGGANGARLLAKFLIALATIVECSGLVPGTEILARDLCEFAWSFRTVDVPEVRSALLVAIANSLAVLRDDALMGVLYSLHDLPEYLRSVALEDSDETCRMIATSISTNVSQLLGNMVDSRRIES